MRQLHKAGLYLLALTLLASCARDNPTNFVVERPISVALQDSLDKTYAPLRTYIDSVNINFTLGAGVSLADYAAREVIYGLVNSNFHEVTAGYGMKHGAVVQPDGSLALEPVIDFLSAAENAGISVYGHTLVWHANQNAEYLNSLIEPTVIPGTGEPTWELVTGADFETDDASNYESNENAPMSFTAVGEGANGEGRALKITNDEVRANDYDSQLFITFSQKVEPGEKYRLSMDVRADDPASYTTQAHIVPYEYKHWDFFGTINATTEWTTYTKEVTITGDHEGSGAIAFNLGNTATSYYFDNIELLKYNENGGPSLDPSVIANTGFENGDTGWIGWGNGSERGTTEDGMGLNGEGHALYATNPSVTDSWAVQTAYDFASPLENGATYHLTFWVKGSTGGSISAGVQTPSGSYPSDEFGGVNVTTEWQQVQLSTTITADDRTRLIISHGQLAGTLYIDDVTLRRVNPDGGGDQIIEKTPEEKREIIETAMEDWITQMLANTSYVRAWDVVNEPMSDGNPYELKTGVGKDLNSDEFYWQDYLGKDYAVKAFKLARKLAEKEDLLFINDYNLEYNLDKCRGLIEYVSYIEDKGAKVDGIGTQMHININTDKQKIAEMFELLAATGKLIKVSELDIGLGDVGIENAVAEHYEQQSEMYKFVVEQYFKIIPEDQRYGITVWSSLDSPESSSWRAGEPIGLWTLDYNRKRAYGGFANGLKSVLGIGD